MSESQAAVVAKLNQTTDNVFVSGEAGTGKSVVLRDFVNTTSKKVVVCAPTGLAANHVDGVTIHSLFRLPLNDHFIDYSPNPDPEADKVLAGADTVVIDEASMVRADMLDAIDSRLRLAREDARPFGGAQMILFGDLLQLPPVTNGNNMNLLRKKYESEFFFDAEASKAAEFVSVELTEILRQQEPDLVAALRRTRVGKIQRADLDLLNTRVAAPTQMLPSPVLATKNTVVNGHNERGLEALPGAPVKFIREWQPRDGLKAPQEAPCESQIVLKVGCPVLFTRNDSELGISNGMSGIVSKLDAESATVQCGRQLIEVEPVSWPVKEYVHDSTSGRVRLVEQGEFIQLPLRLGFAMTIHRSQGQTYDRATIDFSQGRPFAAGQGYVAISRVRQLEGLTLTCALQTTDFKCSRRALAFLRDSLRASNARSSPR
ncbi:MAG: AAA family ATPase [Actinobacteria bacterium]|nr:AAA family ATPase [Actinomycetota bacterium]